MQVLLTCGQGAVGRGGLRLARGPCAAWEVLCAHWTACEAPLTLGGL